MSVLTNKVHMRKCDACGMRNYFPSSAPLHHCVFCGTDLVPNVISELDAGQTTLEW
jgi:hypothetical protein